MSVEEAGGRPDFAHVYRAQLAPVWRYVRSRVPNHHEAQDVTTGVFARAWRSWGRFDSKPGDRAVAADDRPADGARLGPPAGPVGDASGRRCGTRPERHLSHDHGRQLAGARLTRNAGNPGAV